jgi:hypothetical protein
VWDAVVAGDYGIEGARLPAVQRSEVVDSGADFETPRRCLVLEPADFAGGDVRTVDGIAVACQPERLSADATCRIENLAARGNSARPE